MRKTSIKAIETEYNGYLFRSRLEARWAVFFDTLGIRYHYELEGFDIGGMKYLPDFYLPQLECWAEVKPTILSPIEFRKCFASKKRFLLLDGQPELRGFYLLYPQQFPPDMLCTACYQDYLSNDEYGRVHLGWSAGKGRLWFLWGESMDDYCNTYMKKAIKAARQARFEHGG